MVHHGLGIRAGTDADVIAFDGADESLGHSIARVTNVLASDAARGGEEAQGFAITAVQCEGDPHLLTVITANLEAVGAPTSIAFIHHDATVVAPLDTTGVAIKRPLGGSVSETLPIGTLR